MKRLLATLLTVILAFSVVSTDASVINVHAASYGSYGYLNYKIEDGEVLITDCNTSAKGTLIVPSEIEGYPVTEIGDETFSAFEGCSGLTRIEIPDSVISIGVSAFKECSGLTGIEIPDNVKNIGDSAFKYCRKLATVELSENVTSIGEEAFYECTSLKNIRIPSCVTSIGHRAFMSCFNLSNIGFSNGLKYIGNNAFYGCKGIVSLELPNGVTDIGYGVFEDCVNLKSVSLPDSLTSMGSDVFHNCISLINVELPSKTKFIGENMFRGCSSLTHIEIPDYVSKIQMDAFQGCTNLITIELPEGLERIEAYAFRECSNLVSVKMTNSVNYIGSSAFEDCGSLTNIQISNKVKNIMDSVFKGCNNLVDVEIPNSVTTIAPHAFGGCSSLTSMVIPNSVTTIGYCAFQGCSNLTDVEISDSVSKIGVGAFEGCSNLINIKIPFVGQESNGTINQHFGYIFGAEEATNNVDFVPISLKTVIIGETCTRIGNEAFYGCKKLVNIEMTDSVTSIGSYAFYGCSNMSNIKMSNRITNIERAMFNECSSLTSVKIPNNATNIEFMAFYGCNKLTDVEIPKGMKSIESYAFGDCPLLTNVWYQNSEVARSKVDIEGSNEELVTAEWHYNICDTEHIYRSSCDIDCEECDWTRKISNVTHTYDNECDTTCDCGYVRAITHNHQLSYNTHHHYLECTVCGDEINAELHVFENACDTTCDCGYKRTIIHNYQMCYDAEHHYMECTVCGNKINAELHVFENARDATCDCGYERIDEVSAFAGGKGTIEDPYLIATPKQLDNVRRNLNSNFKLIKDIEFSQSDFEEGGAFYNKGQGWIPIKSPTLALSNYFTGVFDGNGYSIYNLQIDVETNSSVAVGLFERNNGTIKNLGMEDFEINLTLAADVYGNAGGITGRNYGTITNCFSSGKTGVYGMIGSGSAGGITGTTSENGTISECYNTGIVYGTYTAGGITGSNSSVIINCFNSGFIHAENKTENNFAGGIAGSNHEQIFNCYNIGYVTSNVRKGGITGIHVEMSSENAKINNCYYLDNISTGTGYIYDEEGTTKCTEEHFKRQDTYGGFDFESVWTMTEDEEYPYAKLKNTTMNFTKEEQGIVISSLPYKTEYYVGLEELDVRGGRIAHIFNDGTYTEVEMDKSMVSGFDKSKTGSQTLIVTYNNSVVSYDVENLPLVYDYNITTDETITLEFTAKKEFEFILSDETIAKITNVQSSVIQWGSSIEMKSAATITPIRPGYVVVRSIDVEGKILTHSLLLIEEGSHQMQFSKIIKETSCAEEGLELHICKFCGYQEEKTIDKLEHAEVVDNAVAPTCVKTGLSEGKHCSTCGEVIVAQSVIPATSEHLWDEGQVADNGDLHYSCTNCDETYTKVLNSIEISKLPSKLLYVDGESLLLEDMEVTAYYSDGSSGRVEWDSIEQSGVTDGVEIVKVLYKNKTATFEIIWEKAGDLNGDDMVTDADALYLLYHTIFGNSYPIEQECDYNKDGSVTDADALYLLYHTIFGDSYPLN